MIQAPVPDLNQTLVHNLALVVGVLGVVIVALVVVVIVQSQAHPPSHRGIPLARSATARVAPSSSSSTATWAR